MAKKKKVSSGKKQSQDDVSEPQDTFQWPDFVVWAKENYVCLEHKDDWVPWWNCFNYGVAIGAKYTTEFLLKQQEERIYGKDK